MNEETEAHISSPTRYINIQVNGSIVFSCKDATGDASLLPITGLVEVAVRCIIRDGLELPVGESFDEVKFCRIRFCPEGKSCCNQKIAIKRSEL